MRFTSGLPPVQGGFTGHDKVNAVLSFARCFFKNDRYILFSNAARSVPSLYNASLPWIPIRCSKSKVALLLPESGAAVENHEATLRSCGLFPRASLIATTMNRESRIERMQEVRSYSHAIILRNILFDIPMLTKTRYDVVRDTAAQIESAERMRLKSSTDLFPSLVVMFSLLIW